jgi:hypothetical protein
LFFRSLTVAARFFGHYKEFSMLRRFLCLGAILFLIALSTSACQKDAAPKKGPTMQDPDGAPKPPAPVRGG